MISILVVVTTTLTQPSWTDEIQWNPPTQSPSVDLLNELEPEFQTVPVAEEGMRTRHAASPPITLAKRHRPGNRSQKVIRKVSATENVATFSHATSPTTGNAVIHAALELTMADTKIQGKKITLLKAVQHQRSRTNRLRVISAYWDLSKYLMQYYFAQQEITELTNLHAHDSPDRELIGVPLATAVSKHARARVALVRAQHQLVRTAQLPVSVQTSDQLPLPADLPWSGRYNTKFDIIFQHRQPSHRLLEINQTLDLNHKIIKSGVMAIHSARRGFRTATEEYQRYEMSVGDLLRYQRELTTHREQFVTAVINYNHDIAEYALAVANQGVQPEKMVTMLVSNRARRTFPPVDHLRAATIPTPSHRQAKGRLRRVPDDEIIPLRPIPDP